MNYNSDKTSKNKIIMIQQISHILPIENKTLHYMYISKANESKPLTLLIEAPSFTLDCTHQLKKLYTNKNKILRPLSMLD